MRHTWITLGLAILSVGINAQQDCNIPSGTSSKIRTGEDALRFSFTSVQSNLGTTLPVFEVEDHVFTVNPDSCTLALFIESEVIQQASPLLGSVDIAGIPISCNPAHASGTVLKFLQNTQPRPLEVPASWYADDRFVLKIIYDAFPTAADMEMRCGVNETFTIFGSRLNVEVLLTVNVTKIGCPMQRYGTNCQMNCNCENGGYCHTFKGDCICPQHYTGDRCETDLRTTMKAVTANTAKTTTLPPAFTIKSSTMTLNPANPSNRDLLRMRELLFCLFVNYNHCF